MLEYLKKTFKITLCSVLCIHLVVCSTDPAILKMHNASDQFFENHHNVTGNEFDHIKHNPTKAYFKECILKGLWNVQQMINQHAAFQVYIPIGVLKENSLLGSDGESLSISNQNKHKALELCTLYDNSSNDIYLNLNNPVSLTTFFIYKSLSMLDRLSNKNHSGQNFEEYSFAHWKLTYTNSVYALKANSNLDDTMFATDNGGKIFLKP